MKKILKHINNQVVHPMFRKLCGMSDYELQIETLYDIINHCIDITSVPKAEGVLRKVQLADAEMLKFVCAILEKYDLTYWIDWGTLLGAVRHSGFIPWDDDMDMSMPREDYSKARTVLASELANTCFEFIPDADDRHVICYWKAGMILDIFPMDTVSEKEVLNKDDLKSRIGRYYDWYKKNKRKKSADEISAMKKKIIGSPCNSNPLWFKFPESGDKFVYKHSTIFPLKKVAFEGYQFAVPNDYDGYLKEGYGDYMAFPRNGFLHHNASTNSMWKQSIKNHIDMDVLISELRTQNNK